MVAIEMNLPDDKSPWQWLVRVKKNAVWQTAIVPGRENRHAVALPADARPTTIVVSAVTRLSREGPRAHIQIDGPN
jgi:hypothetical protein